MGAMRDKKLLKHYHFKNEHWGDDWNLKSSYAVDEEEFAAELAEKFWVDDPGSPDNFRFEVIVRKGDGLAKRFIVTASQDVYFHTNEVDLEEE